MFVYFVGLSGCLFTSATVLSDAPHLAALPSSVLFDDSVVELLGPLSGFWIRYVRWCVSSSPRFGLCTMYVSRERSLSLPESRVSLLSLFLCLQSSLFRRGREGRQYR